MMSGLVSIPCRIVERHERAVIAMVGAPERPTIIPLAGVDFEPAADLLGSGEAYRASMTLSLAKSIGLL